MFQEWRTRYLNRQAQKQRMLPLVQMLSKVNKESAFKKWQKNSFRLRFLNTLRKNLLFTSEVATARECLQAWRKHASFNKSKPFH